MFAHIAGIPVEELLPWLVPVGGFAVASAAAWLSRTAQGGRR